MLDTLNRITLDPDAFERPDDPASDYERVRRIIAHISERWREQPSLEDIAEAVHRLAMRPDVAVIFPVHLNPNVIDVVHGRLAGLDNVALTDPIDYPHFARLMDICHIMLTDSGGVQEEAPALGTPVLVMRDTTERPEGIAAGTARLVGKQDLGCRCRGTDERRRGVAALGGGELVRAEVGDPADHERGAVVLDHGAPPSQITFASRSASISADE